MASLLPNGKQTFLDQNGEPLAGGTVTFYVPGTTTFKDTYQDAAATIRNTNPIVLDASGQATIYGGGSYRQVVKDQFGNVIWDQQTADTALSTTSWAAASRGVPNAQIVAAPNFSSQDGQTIDFIAGFTNTSALSLNPNGLVQINVKRDSVTGPVNCNGGEVVAGNVYRATYDATAGCFHLAFVMDKSYVDTRDNAILASAATDATTKSGNAQTAAQNFATTADAAVLANAEYYSDNTSKPAAVTAAAADATTKANAAQSAAISAAATDAQTRATAAQTNAQNFATSADTTVTTNANSFATTKANAAQAAAIADALTKYISSIRIGGEFSQSNAAARVPGTVVVNVGGSVLTLRYIQGYINGSWVTISDY